MIWWTIWIPDILDHNSYPIVKWSSIQVMVWLRDQYFDTIHNDIQRTDILDSVKTGILMVWDIGISDK